MVDRASRWQDKSACSSSPQNFRYPYSRPDADRIQNYRAFKIQFQCLPNNGLFTWKIYLVTDIFAGEEAKIDKAVSFFVSRILFIWCWHIHFMLLISWKLKSPLLMKMLLLVRNAWRIGEENSFQGEWWWK